MSRRFRLLVATALAVLMLGTVAAPAMAQECPPPTDCGCGCAPGVASPGFWKNHPDEWPVESLTIGGKTFTKAEAIEMMSTPDKGDKRYTMFRAFAAAMLNHAAGNPCTPELCAMAAEVDAWFAANWCAPVAGSSCAWKMAEPWYLAFDAYNNGKMGVPSRD